MVSSAFYFLSLWERIEVRALTLPSPRADSGT
jgi:hypothetical protein